MILLIGPFVTVHFCLTSCWLTETSQSTESAALARVHASLWRPLSNSYHLMPKNPNNTASHEVDCIIMIHQMTFSAPVVNYCISRTICKFHNFSGKSFMYTIFSFVFILIIILFLYHTVMLRLAGLQVTWPPHYLAVGWVSMCSYTSECTQYHGMNLEG